MSTPEKKITAKKEKAPAVKEKKVTAKKEKKANVAQVNAEQVKTAA